MWKYTTGKMYTRCAHCEHGCNIPYIDILRDRGYTRVSCRYSLGSNLDHLPRYISDVIKKDMVNIIVMNHAIIDESIKLNQIMQDMILRVEYIPLVDNKGTQAILVC